MMRPVILSSWALEVLRYENIVWDITSRYRIYQSCSRLSGMYHLILDLFRIYAT
ncbi:hypothetical protein SLEP1_g40866 [Rubroshorea leprosula]|uniref:Uncharacterized protein n=1 Tax=Rubroshorea leprosula TaxID=152421 RepID=A0AAV5L5C7_9ROSI|nr:hypothetical protein SLEP1_g40866 [Rubroshorea leprosula]